MRYIRKVMATGLAIVFLIALVIGMGVIFSVRNVNVTFLEYSGNYGEEYEEIRSNLDQLKGSGLLFISDDTIEEKNTLKQIFAVDSYEKKFPCTINVVLRERVESFALKTETGYSVYDEKGNLIRAVLGDGVPQNSVDGCPDVLLEVPENDVKQVAGIMARFQKNFGSLRRLVVSVSIKKYLELQVLSINLRSGMNIALSEWKTGGEEKIDKAFEVYDSLTDAQRIKGAITVVDGRDGTPPVARYSAQQ